MKEADKGGNDVLWPIAKYTQEAHRQLGNPCYVKLPSARSFGIISKQEHAFLTVDKPVTPTFYILPILHKDPVSPLGRPIVAGIGGLSEKACLYIDYYLQPLVAFLLA